MKKQLLLVFGIAVATLVPAIALTLLLVSIHRPASATTEQAVMEANTGAEGELVLGHGDYKDSDVTVIPIQESVRE